MDKEYIGQECLCFIDKKIFKDYLQLVKKDFWGFSKILIYSHGIKILSEPSNIFIIIGIIDDNILDHGIIPHPNLYNMLKLIDKDMEDVYRSFELWYSSTPKSLLIKSIISSFYNRKREELNKLFYLIFDPSLIKSKII